MATNAKLNIARSIMAMIQQSPCSCNLVVPNMVTSAGCCCLHLTAASGEEFLARLLHPPSLTKRSSLDPRTFKHRVGRCCRSGKDVNHSGRCSSLHARPETARSTGNARKSAHPHEPSSKLRPHLDHRWIIRIRIVYSDYKSR